MTSFACSSNDFAARTDSLPILNQPTATSDCLYDSGADLCRRARGWRPAVDEPERLYQELLVVRCQLGERAAMEELVRRWERPLLFYIRRFVPDGRDPLQVMQEVWVKVLGGLTSLRDPARLAPWLYTLARNAVMDHLREQYRREPLVEPERADEDASGDDGMNWFVAAEEVHYGLSRVSVVDREVLTLYFLNDLSVDDIAGVLGIPAGTVKSRLFYARKNLRDVLQPKEGVQR